MSQAALPKGENTQPQYYKQKKLYSYLQAILMSFYIHSLLHSIDLI